MSFFYSSGKGVALRVGAVNFGTTGKPGKGKSCKGKPGPPSQASEKGKGDQGPPRQQKEKGKRNRAGHRSQEALLRRDIKRAQVCGRSLVSPGRKSSSEEESDSERRRAREGSSKTP